MVDVYKRQIPGFNKIEADSETIAKRFVFFGDTVVIGIIIGMIVGFLAKYDFAKAAQLGMATGAVMKIMPKMVAMFMEGLMPIAEAAKEFANKRLGGRSVNTVSYTHLLHGQRILGHG